MDTVANSHSNDLTFYRGKYWLIRLAPPGAVRRIDVGTQSLRIITLGEFSAEMSSLITHLDLKEFEVSECHSLKLLPTFSGSQEVLLTEQSWLCTLSSVERGELSERAREVAEWIVLSDAADSVRDQIEWQRLGVTLFSQCPLDVDCVVSLIEAAQTRCSAHPLRVILLDCNQASLTSKAEALKDVGISVFSTPDPLAALDAVNHFKPDVLVASAHLPSLAAGKLLVIARQRPENISLPVIFLTRDADLETMPQVKVSSGVCFLIEPVGLELLVATLSSQALGYRAVKSAFVRVREDARRARARLKALRSAIDQHAIISVADGAGNIVHVNDRFCQISGYSRKELLGKNHRLIKSTVHDSTYYQALWRTISAGKTWRGELCNRAKNGDAYWVEATIIPFLDAAGKPVQYMSVRTDITALKCSENALRLSHERLRLSQEVTSIGTWDVTLANGDVSCSDRTLQLFGFAAGVLQRDYGDFLIAVHIDDRQKLTRIINVSIENRSPYEIEFRVVWPDNTVHWLQEKGAVVSDETDGALHMLGVVQDIHVRKMAEIALAESEVRFRGAFEASGIGMALISLSGAWLLVNSALCSMLGFSEDELLATDFKTLTHPDDIAVDQAFLSKLLSSEMSNWQHEKRYYAKGGRIVWVLLNISAVLNDDGQYVHFVYQVQDITARKIAEQRLALFRNVFDASGQCVSITDGQGLIIYQNKRHAQELGYSDKECIGQPFTLFLPEKTAGTYATELLSSAAEGKSWVGYIPIRRKDGSVYISASSIGFVRGERGDLQNLFNIFTDFSEELARRNELADARKAADQANQAKSDFLSSMSHELRTPMNAVLGFAQMLECDSELNADQKDSVQEILKGGKHLLELINEVLDLASIESGHVSLSLEAVELASLLKECWSFIHILAEARHITLSLNVPTGIVVWADRVRLKQVFLNLLSNAVKYNREGGDISVGVQPVDDDEKLRITLTDTGVGIPSDRVPELFQPFNRLGAELSGIEGTGIGLTISRRLIALMGGAVGVVSEEGVGTTFWIELPTQPTEERLDSNNNVGNTTPVGTEPTGEKCVLYLDDNPVNVKLMAGAFARHSHLHLVTAVTPPSGVELAVAYRPDAILLDLNMQSMDGYKLLNVLKGRLEKTPIIALTANAMPHDIEKALSAGFAKCLTKPIDFGLLMSTVEGCLADSKEAQT
ncbi:PAS domain S-box protein [Pseudomonas sp. UMAB-08]|uniref:PAS domain S-box protein n=1 Tax=Pseudomonas sp. UMAB-08 TaxID=1365375 RepID=UPI001C58621D|nr:PAS domain S-box protein [Pseudomonas sp. UMAB-08]